EFDSPPGPAYLTHFQPYPVGESIDDRVDLFSATVEADLGFAKLTNATGYFNRHMEQVQDASEATSWTLESFLVTPAEQAAVGMPTYIQTPIYEAEPEHQWTEELRLNSSNSDTLHWVTGLFYSRLNSAFNNEWGYFFTPQAQPLPNPPGNFASASGVIPRADVAWMPNQNLTTYVSASKGFRPGGANMTIPLSACPEGGPASFDPDTVWNYEAGEKALLADNRIRGNADIYYIKWDKVQQTALLSCGTQYTTNAGDGSSYGPEIEIAAKIREHWTFSLAGTWTRAYITSVNPSYVGSLANSGYSFPGCGANGCTSVPILN